MKTTQAILPVPAPAPAGTEASADITPVILTYNEAPNIRRTLERLSWAREIVVVDSGSTDETQALVIACPAARLVTHRFDAFADQLNFALDQCATEWVLSLDADHVLSDNLMAELKDWRAAPGVTAYNARFSYCIAGRPLRGSLYPPRPVLFRRVRCRFEPEGHSQRLVIEGKQGWLAGCIFHDDRKPMDRWFSNQIQYAEQEARHLENIPWRKLKGPDRLRRMVIPAPFLVLFYTLLVRGLILDGWPGWYYVFQRTLAEMVLSIKIIERKLR